MGVPVQPLNLSPPGVSFVVAVFDALVFDVAFAFACAFACAVAEALALGPADELDWELSSAFFACPLFSADAEAEAVTLAEV